MKSTLTAAKRKNMKNDPLISFELLKADKFTKSIYDLLNSLKEFQVFLKVKHVENGRRSVSLFSVRNLR